MTEILLADPPCRVTVQTNSRARRLILRLDPGGNGAILTIPPKVPEPEYRGFLARHSDWLRRALARQPARIAVANGIEIPVSGAGLRIEVEFGRRSAPRIDGKRLVLPGAGAVGTRVAAFLKLRARDRIEPAARLYARKVGRRAERIALRDTRSRWGSCSTTGTLSFSWRLAMAPDAVADYVAAHEAAHLVEMNHSPRFWRIVADLVPDWKTHRDWLKANGRGLHCYDFTRQ